MNKVLLRNTHSNLMGWLTKFRHETVPTDKRLEIVMMALADMCQALATDGTPESTEEFYRDPDASG
jgi:hypothetical protein